MSLQSYEQLVGTVHDAMHFVETYENPLSTTSIKLNDGVVIPQIGLGMYAYHHVFRFHDTKHKKTYRNDDEKAKLQEADEEEKIVFKNAVKYGIINGYRHIDGADTYRNSKQIGQALKELIEDKVIERKDIFITTKIGMNVRSAKQTIERVNQTLKEFQTDYIDLYLIHSPHTSAEKGKRGRDVVEVYETLHELKKENKIRSVGVSNFNSKHIDALLHNGLPLPSVNQFEVHCFLYEKELIEYCRDKGINVEAYCPLARARDTATNNSVLKEIASRYGKNKTWAHVMIRWCFQHGFIVLPKSTKLHRIIANGDIFDFEIDKDDMNALNELSKFHFRAAWNPLTVEWDI
eukprot:82288_1